MNTLKLRQTTPHLDLYSDVKPFLTKVWGDSAKASEFTDRFVSGVEAHNDSYYDLERLCELQPYEGARDWWGPVVREGREEIDKALPELVDKEISIYVSW